jgi:hypothetical protein
MNQDDITFDDCMREINFYKEKIMQYLNTGKMDMKPNQYMTTYTFIIRMCDEYDKAADLYNIYKKILEEFINQSIA